LSIVVALVTLFPVTTRGQGGPGARDFQNTPVNAVGFFLDYINNEAETEAASELPLPNNERFSRLGTATLLWSFPLGNRYGGLSLTGGYTSVKGTGPLGNVEASGFSDPGITFHANIFGAPALNKDQYAQAIPQSFSSFHLTVNAPLGSYDRNSAVNTGANRWAFNPLVNLCITPDKGVLWIDLYAGGRFFTNNHAFQGNQQLSQNSLGIFAVHYSHNIGKRMYASIGVYYDNGGETFVNDMPQHNAANGFRPGASISRKIGAFRVTLRYEITASTPNAVPTNGLLAIRLSGPLFSW
jgi:Putative MetA-pathway of phenol degradation